MEAHLKTQYRRHGDVILLTKKGFKIPDSVKMKPAREIHKGTNNSHVITDGEMEISEFDGKKKFIRILSDATVSHVGGTATHDSKPLPAGDYWAEIQTYYDHIAEEKRAVVD